MSELAALASNIAKILSERKHTISVAESSTGGLISAALLAVPGASSYFLGGAVVYTGQAKQVFVGLNKATTGSYRPATPRHAIDLARCARDTLGATWGLGETGAAGPTPNRYGDPPGHTCIAVAGPIDLSTTIETGQSDRESNMNAFAAAALRLVEKALIEGPPT